MRAVFGVKKEIPIHTTLAAIFCAINDALTPLGLQATESPATPLRLWNLMQQAKSH